MSAFGSFSSLVKDATTDSASDTEVHGLPCYKFTDLVNKDEIGRGGFATVFTAEFPIGGQKVVIKKFLGIEDDLETKRKLFKEAKLLNSLAHPNIVEFKGVCSDQYALLLEYVYFDFKPFGLDTRVNCLADLLGHFDRNDCENIDQQVFYKVAHDVVSGLDHLHGKGITHRDLKPANILVSNQHYCQLSDLVEMEKISSKLPLVCKLTDFGESRSQDFNTNTIVSSKTHRVNRGTPVFMAPEILVKELQLPLASFEDLQRADMWAYGMVLFSLTNPGLKHPFQINMQSGHFAGKTPLLLLEMFVKSKEKPKEQRKYAEKQNDEWRFLVKLYKTCTNFQPSSRPSTKDVIAMINKEKERHAAPSCSAASEKEKAVSANVAVPEKTSHEIHLRISQSSFLENFDRNVAAELRRNPLDSSDTILPEVLLGDGTNACAFLCLKIAHEILARSPNDLTSWQELAKISEDVIANFPQAINQRRDISKHYDIVEAYNIVREIGLPSSYEFFEKLPYSYGVFTEDGKKTLLEAAISMRDGTDLIDFYTCKPYIFIFGSLMGKLFVLDTHPVPPSVGGNSTGIIKYFPGTAEESAHFACMWLWKRLECSGVMSDRPQSLLLMTNSELSSVHHNDSKQVNHQFVLQQDQHIAKTFASGQNTDHQEQKCWQPRLLKTTAGEQYDEMIEVPIISLLSSGSVEGEDRETDKSLKNCQEESPTATMNRSLSKSSNNIDVSKGSKTAKRSLDTSSSEEELLSDEELLVQTFKPIGEAYKEDTMTPVFAWNKTAYTAEQLVCILLGTYEQEQTCISQPINVSHNVSFLVDTRSLQHADDLKCDDMGAWKHNGSPKCSFQVVKDSRGIKKIVPMGKNRDGSTRKPIDDMYDLRRAYYQNISDPTVRKIVCKLYDNSSQQLPFVLVQYLFNGPEHEVNRILPHGNAKTRSSYKRLLPSTREKLKNSVMEKEKTAKEALDEVYVSAGDVIMARSASELPRGPTDIYNARRSARQNFDPETEPNNRSNKTEKSVSSKNVKLDSVWTLLEHAKREEDESGHSIFIRECSIHPDLFYKFAIFKLNINYIKWLE